jgi:hypothetical protein
MFKMATQIGTDVLDAWSLSIARAWEAAKPFLAHREHRHGYNPHIGFEPLAQDALKHLANKGIPLKYIAWRRTGWIPDSPHDP